MFLFRHLRVACLLLALILGFDSPSQAATPSANASHSTITSPAILPASWVGRVINNRTRMVQVSFLAIGLGLVILMKK